MNRVVLAVCSILACSMIARAEQSVPLTLEAKIPLGDIKGRIDHMAIDPGAGRLFVAALGNNTVEVVDLDARKVTRTLTGLDEPQGIAYVERTRKLYVASGGDGSLHAYEGTALTPAGVIRLGDDADNVRFDPQRDELYVGCGSGALAIIDMSAHRKVADIPLREHPESFQLESSGPRIFVNVPEASEIAVVDRVSHQQVASWRTGDLHANYPMALDEPGRRLLAVFRRPATLAVFNLTDGSSTARVATCGDADDIFVDARRARVYVSCGDGSIDVLSSHDDSYTRIARVKTIVGARTALFSPQLDRLFLAARASGDSPAAIWIFQPSP